MANNKIELASGETLIDLTGDTVTAAKMLSGTTAHDKSGAAISGSINSKAATTYNTSTGNQTIASGQYLSGTQTIRAVTTSNITAENIKSGVNVKVGDSASAGRIASVTGTFTSDATAAAGNILSGKTAYVNGSKITGTAAASVSGTTLIIPEGLVKV